MPRIARVVAVGLPHHVTQRGNFGIDVFENDTDRRKYLEWLADYAEKHALKIAAYCLMANHVHYIAVPEKPDSLARTFNNLHMRYAAWKNTKTERRGHLWQGRFYSCVLDDRHLLNAVRYVEANPVRAGIVDRAEDYAWSSAAAHVFGKADPLLTAEIERLAEIEDWRALLREKDGADWVEDFRLSTRTGRPFGGAGFRELVGRMLKRELGPKKRGRPPGSRNKKKAAGKRSDTKIRGG